MSHFTKNQMLDVESCSVDPKKYAHGFVVLCFVVVMQSFIMNSHEVFIHIHQGYFAGTGAIVRLPQCQWSKPDGYEKISSMYNHNKAQQSKNRVHISWDILYVAYVITGSFIDMIWLFCYINAILNKTIISWYMEI